ncbi:hypothetical protein [Butyrivibrio sp. AE3004]|uniref:hypothetical protein n=1 Tax=Butyrivibrio sp. AE3004 TaxID=1506994 RepID=UPI000B2594C2|nr:hypothetical protein [Butyrivibrio sp. AE3004]
MAWVVEKYKKELRSVFYILVIVEFFRLKKEQLRCSFYPHPALCATFPLERGKAF